MNVVLRLHNLSDKDGSNHLFFYITGRGKRASISSGVKIFPQNWKNGTIQKREPNADLKKSLIQARLSLINKIITEAKIKGLDPSPSDIKEEYAARNKPKQKEENILGKQNLIKSTELYREKYKNMRKESTLRCMQQFSQHVAQFDPDICLEDIDHDWMVSYFSYLVDIGLQDTTIKYRHLKSLKIIIAEARKNQIKVSTDVDDFKWKANHKQPFYATWEEVQKISEISEFKIKSMEIIRDIFLLSCFTGLRESDLHMINRQNIHRQGSQKMIRIIVTKTDLDYSIPLSKQVEEILIKYDYKIPFYTQQHYNRLIKDIAKMAGIEEMTKVVKSSGSKRTTEQKERWKLFTSHTGRRTFGRRFLDRGGSLLILSKLFGHKNIETTLHYVGYQPMEIVSEFKKVFG